MLAGLAGSFLDVLQPFFPTATGTWSFPFGVLSFPIVSDRRFSIRNEIEHGTTRKRYSWSVRGGGRAARRGGDGQMPFAGDLK